MMEQNPYEENLFQFFIAKFLAHTVCAFNRDGSVCNQIENNNTIIVDSWCGMVDFANNMIHNYKNMFQEHFKIPKNKKI